MKVDGLISNVVMLQRHSSLTCTQVQQRTNVLLCSVCLSYDVCHGCSYISAQCHLLDIVLLHVIVIWELPRFVNEVKVIGKVYVQ